ncbi:FHA domain-containing protein [Nonomuraea phyllanthi]|uniref:FHA domain-containing protein n=1 Tax=Nonomuraea phyllanthi TaxID=2219224 RepID=A0A5C4WRN6_9ACTN|nr:FHA domain-containing protein [Nonomuraea phyllanthi]KAB8195868.1 FHA domain-containing protein [Nonomuraea phyllanthi]QFY07323.1 FHA domain-containing protein [Nonomuraea phyllanthi]
MATCPQGHPSGADDYCDVCGAQMTGVPAPQPQAAANPQGTASAAPGAAGSCPVCQTPRAGQFCEVCGHDYSGTSAPVSFAAAGARWEAVAAADRTYYEKVIAEGGPDASTMAFPPYCPERSFALTGEQVRIGRRSRARNASPEIDLTGPPEDPGVSHLHAVLLGQPDGSWLLVDPGSANGTQLNGRPVTVNVPVRVGPGDRIHLGAWTVITIREGTP